MSDTEERIVSLKFDNTGFEAGATKAIDILGKLSEKLKLDGASDGLDKVRGKIASFNMNAIPNSIENVKGSFSAFQAFTFGIFSNIGKHVSDFAVDMGRKLKGALTGPAKDGFNEYELNMKSLQTISANSGESFEVINRCLDELNTYADKTIYKFSDMTQNIGRFTAAGLGVEDSTNAIKGFANAAALAGAGPQEAARGMYQLSQAMAAGVVKLQDWKSIQNASIDTEAFKQVIIETARKFGTSVDSAIAKEGSFNASLSEGWLTADVMQEALENLTLSTRDFSDEEEGMAQRMKELTDKGYSEEVAKKIIDIANAADDSAREIRTFSQLMDTMGEAIGTGWADTWKTIIGDFDQATSTFTWLGQRFENIVGRFSDARNNLLKGWAEAGGRDALFGALVNAIEAVDRVLQSVETAFHNVFGITGEELATMTENFALWTENLVADKETMDAITDVFTNIFTIADSVFGVIRDIREIVVKIFESAAPLWKKLFDSFLKGVEAIAKIANHIRHVFDFIDKFMSGDLYKKKKSKYKELDDVLLTIFNTAKKVSDKIKQVFDLLVEYWPVIVSTIGSVVSTVLSVIADVVPIAATVISTAVSIIGSVASFIVGIITKVIEFIPTLKTIFSPVLQIFDAISGAVSYLSYIFEWFFNTVKETFGGMIDWSTVVEFLATVFDSLCQAMSIVITVGSYFIGFIVGVIRTVMVVASPIIRLAGIIINVGITILTKVIEIIQDIRAKVADAVVYALDVMTRMLKPVRRIFKEIYKLGKYFFKALFRVITNTELFKTVKDSFTRIKDTVIEVFKAFTPKSLGLKHTIAWYFIHPLKVLKDVLVDFASNHRVKFFREWIEKVGGVISFVFGPAINTAIELIKGFTDIITGPVADGLKWLAEQIGNYEFKSPIDTLYDGVAAVVDWISNLEIPNPFEAISEWLSSFDFNALIDNSPFKGIKDWFTSLNISEIIDKSPLGKLKEIFSNFKFKNPFANIKIPKTLSEAVDTLKSKFSNLKTKAEGATTAVKEFAKRTAQKIKITGSGKLATVIGTIADAFNNLISYFKNLYQTKSSITDAIAQIFQDIYGRLREGAAKLADSANGIAQGIGKAFQFFLDQVEKVPSLLSGLFGDADKAVSDGADKVKDAAGGAKDKVGELGDDLANSLPSSSGFLGAVGSFFGEIKSGLESSASTIFGDVNFGDLLQLQGLFDAVVNLKDFKFEFPDFITPAQDLVDKFNEFINSIDTDALDTKSQWILDFMNRMVKGLAAFEGIKWLNSLSKMNKGLAKGGDGLGKFFENLPKDLGGGLSKLGENITKGLFKPVGDGMTNFGKSMEQAAKSFSPFKDLGKPSKSEAFLNVALALLALAGALFALSKIPADDLQRAGTAMLQLLGAVGGFMLIAGWLSNMAKLDFTGIGIALAGVGAALVGFAIALWAFTALSKDPAIVTGMENFELVVEILTGMMAALLILSGNGGDIRGAGIAMLAISAAILLMIPAIWLLGSMSQPIMWRGLNVVENLSLLLTGCISLMALAGGNAQALLAGAAAMIVLAVCITAMIIPITLYGVLATYAGDIGQNGLDAISIIGLVLVGLIGILSAASINVAGILASIPVMAALVIAITAMIVPIMLIGMLSTKYASQIQQGIIAVGWIGLLLAGLIGVLSLVSVNPVGILAAIPAMLGMVVAVGILTVVVGALSILAAYNYDGIVTAIETITIIVLLLISLSVFSGGGTGLIGVGLGLLVVAAGITALGAAAAFLMTIDWGAIAAGLSNLWNSFAQTTAGQVIIGFANAISGALGVISSCAQWIYDAFIHPLLSLLGIASPSKETEAIGGFCVDGFFQGVTSALGLTDEAGSEMGGSFLDGLEGEDLPTKLGDIASNGISGFLKSISEGDLPGELGKTANDALDGFLDGFNMEELSNKGVEMISSLASGITSGITEKLSNKASEVFWGFTHPFESLMGMKPPSTTGEKMTNDIATGITNATPNVATASSQAGAAVTSGLSNLPFDVSNIGTQTQSSLQSILGGENGYATMFGNANTTGLGYTDGMVTGLSGVPVALTDMSNQAGVVLDELGAKTENKGLEVAGKTGSGIKNGTGKAKGAVTNMVNQSVSAATPFANKMRAKGNDGVTAFASAIRSGTGKASSAAGSLVRAAANAAGSLYGRFYSTGRSASEGLAAGMWAGVGSVEAAANRMIEAADRAARAKAKVNSPSKVFMVTGRSLGEGLTVGMDQMGKTVSMASAKMIDSAKSGADDALKSMSMNLDDVIDTDYSPVITPVIDSTEFDSGLSSMITSINTSPLGDLSIGEINYNEQFSGKLDAVVDANKQAVAALSKNGIDYGLLGQSVAAALISSGVHVEIDGGQLMGYLAGEIRDARRMYG